jgi:endonuclease/exonuclease/phosphatase family metal-dependent hydrolase
VILRLLSYNIRYGGTGHEAALAAMIRSATPDLVVLQEATNPQVVERLAADSGMTQWGSRAGHSLGFMSRIPARPQWHRPRVSRHAFLEVALAGTPFRVFGVHLSAVHAAWTERRRVYELRAMLAAIGREQPGPHALVGDFNTLAPGELLEVRKLPTRLRALVWLSGGRIRWRTIQTILDAGYADAYRHCHADLVGNTFPTWDPHVRLDYLFVPGGFVSSVQACDVVVRPEAKDGSDHFPLCAVLDVSTQS